MNALLVTIVGPDDSTDLKVNGDLPLVELMPELLRSSVDSGHTRPEEWTLAPLTGAPLSPARTLTESGVVDGQVLRLRQSTGPSDAAREAAPRRQVVEPGSPLARGRAALPPRATALDRLRSSRDYFGRLEVAIRDPPLRRSATIAVVSPKGGVGKSTVSILLGALLSQLRVEPVIAVDADSDYGSLGPWLAPDHAFSVSNLVDSIGQRGQLGFADAELDRQFAAGPDQLRILPAPSDPARMAQLDRPRYSQALERLQRRAEILILDCGTGLGQPGVQAAIWASSQLVLVTDEEPASVAQVAQAAALLRHAERPITVVVNRAKITAAERIDAQFPYAAALLSIADERAAARALCSGTFTSAGRPSQLAARGEGAGRSPRLGMAFARSGGSARDRVTVKGSSGPSFASRVEWT